MKNIFQLIKVFFKNFLIGKFRIIWKKLTADWHIYPEKPVTVDELDKSRKAGSIPSFSFFFLLICASVISTLGLILNSTAVIIGAMIVSPLMTPILSMAFAIVTANWNLYRLSILTVSSGAICTILVSFLITICLPVNVVGTEIIGRIRPNLIDLVIAVAAGAAGSFSLTRQSIANSIAGVAIAVALVPPLCVTGIGLAMGSNIPGVLGMGAITEVTVSAGAFLLFLVNLVGITFTSCLVFLSQSYGNFKKAFQMIIIWLLIMGLLSTPLSNSMKEFFVSNRVYLELRKIREDHPEISRKTQIRDVRVNLEGNTAYVSILIIAPRGIYTREYLEKNEKRVFESLKKMGIKSIKLVLRIVPVEIEEYTGVSE